MFKYPRYINEQIVRPTATTVFCVSSFILITGMHSLAYLLFVDFILRLAHPRLSPHTWLHVIISEYILKQQKEARFSPPNRFATLIGTTVTLCMSVSHYLEWSLVFVVLTAIMIFASGLQGIYGYCIGCEIHNLLIKAGVIGPKKPPLDFLGDGI